MGPCLSVRAKPKTAPADNSRIDQAGAITPANSAGRVNSVNEQTSSQAIPQVVPARKQRRSSASSHSRRTLFQYKWEDGEQAPFARGKRIYLVEGVWHVEVIKVIGSDTIIFNLDQFPEDVQTWMSSSSNAARNRQSFRNALIDTVGRTEGDAGLWSLDVRRGKRDHTALPVSTGSRAHKPRRNAGTPSTMPPAVPGTAPSSSSSKPNRKTGGKSTRFRPTEVRPILEEE